MKRASKLSFESVGGLQEHVQILKEMIIYPFLYGDLLESYGIQPPRGVLFYGPPGTGKTLMAGAVAAECSKSSARNVSFYMRKGGECLNKYVGESEKNLKDLFTEAYRTRPSIIFFDELDGLVPIRSETQEQVHTSVVTTLLGLMDGLDSKSEVFVIGATNRIDMIDPALRRPGRFDKELYFPLPPVEARLEIFKVHTKNWKEKPSEKFLLELAADCSGYCGADIQSLCSQAVMRSFNRNFPQAADISKKQSFNLRNILIKESDFWEAKEEIIPATQRVFISSASPLRRELQPLLKKNFDEIISDIIKLCPFCFMYRKDMNILKSKSLSCPRFLLIGKVGQAHISHLAPAVLHYFDHLSVVVMDLTSVNKDKSYTYSNPFVQKIEEARQNMPSIIYLKNITAWWNLINQTEKQTLTSSLEELDTSSNCKIFIFGSASVYSYDYLPSEIKQMFPKRKSFTVKDPTIEEKKKFFSQVIVEKNLLPSKTSKSCIPCDTKLDSSFENKRNESDGLNGDTTSRLRNGKNFRRSDNEYNRPPKKLRFQVSFDPCSSWNFDLFKTSESKIDIKKLQKITDSAVRATAKASISSMIRLYEELEIISLRFASKKDRSLLLKELQREISIFTPS